MTFIDHESRTEWIPIEQKNLSANVLMIYGKMKDSKVQNETETKTISSTTNKTESKPETENHMLF
jgi:hypothetical protein